MKFQTYLKKGLNLLASVALATTLLPAPLAATNLNFTLVGDQNVTLTGTLTGAFAQGDPNLFYATGLNYLALNGTAIEPDGVWQIGSAEYIADLGRTGNPVGTVSLDGLYMDLGLYDGVAQIVYIATINVSEFAAQQFESDIWYELLQGNPIHQEGVYTPAQWDANTDTPEPATWILAGTCLCFGVLRTRRRNVN